LSVASVKLLNPSTWTGPAGMSNQALESMASDGWEEEVDWNDFRWNDFRRINVILKPPARLSKICCRDLCNYFPRRDIGNSSSIYVFSDGSPPGARWFLHVRMQDSISNVPLRCCVRSAEQLNSFLKFPLRL
jgi:hypothetical protein